MAEKWSKGWLRSLQLELQSAQHPDAMAMKQATPMTIDFHYTMDVIDEPSGYAPLPVPFKLDPDGKKLTPKNVRVRLNKKRKRTGGMAEIKPYELATLYGDRKPLEEWDAEELARGRPRNKDGKFAGPKPQYVTMQIHEEAVDRFSKFVKTEMSVSTIEAIEQLNKILSNDEQDYRGKPVIPPSVKLDAAKFLIEHIVGKPKQHIEQDVSIKLQSILGSVIVNPDESPDVDLNHYQPAHLPGVTMQLASREEANEYDGE